MQMPSTASIPRHEPPIGRVLLTGATGVPGGCIARELLGRGCDLVLLVR
jgi:short-subunit dehydrogenase